MKKKKETSINYICHTMMSWFECKYCKRMNILSTKEGVGALKKHRNQWIKVK